MEKIRIGGIRVSDPLLLIEIHNPPGGGDPGHALIGRLAEERINIHFLSAGETDGLHELSCCVQAGAEGQVKALAESEPSLKGRVKLVPSVGLLSLFPHQYRLKILGLSLSALGRDSIPLFGMNTSISSLTFVTDFGCLDRAVDLLENVLEFPRKDRGIRTETATG
jgi:hypothetical protein